MDQALTELGEYIGTALPVEGADIADVGDELVLTVPAGEVERALTWLRDDAQCLFKVLVDICGVDYPERERRFEVVYNLLSLRHNQRIRVKVAVDADDPGALGGRRFLAPPGWYEREAWDLYGIYFAGNPDLRRIMTDYGFEGHPLRKDFPLTGFVELRYDDEQKRCAYEPVRLTQDLRDFDFMSPWEGAGYVLPGDEKAGGGRRPGARGLAENEIKNLTMNFGPQHPAAHGVLRLVVEMDGEVIERADPHIGLLHRGTEKLIEHKTYTQAVPYFDRLDYVSPMCQEHAFALATEKLLGIEVPERGQYVRVLFSEITPAAQPHHECLRLRARRGRDDAVPLGLRGTRKDDGVLRQGLAARGSTPPISVPGGVHRDLPAGLVGEIAAFCETFPKFIDDTESLLTENRIFKQRYRRYRRHLAEDALDWGLSGPDAARLRPAVGSAQGPALRRLRGRMDFDIPVGKNGDCYDRYLVRIEEMRQIAQHHRAVPGRAAGRAGQDRGPQGHAARAGPR